MEMQQYKHVERLIKKSKKLLIVSPYIDSYYAKFIARNARGKKIYIITSSPDKDAYKILTKGEFPKLSFSLSFLFIAAYLLLLYAGINIAPMLILALFAILVFLIKVINAKPRGIQVKVPKGFVHAKFYVGENEAITGSANLTYRGMHKNIEHIEVRNDPEYVKKIEEEFWRMWKEI